MQYCIYTEIYVSLEKHRKFAVRGTEQLVFPPLVGSLRLLGQVATVDLSCLDSETAKSKLDVCGNYSETPGLI